MTTPIEALNALRSAALHSGNEFVLDNMQAIVRDALSERTAYQATVENTEGRVIAPTYKVVETRTFFTTSPNESIRDQTPVESHLEVTRHVPLEPYTVVLSRTEQGDEFFAHVLALNINQAMDYAMAQAMYDDSSNGDGYCALAVFQGHVYSLI